MDEDMRVERWDRLLDGRVAVVTGGGGGIGGAVARLFAGTVLASRFERSSAESWQQMTRCTPR
jgi:NAD(P)-dependent dehydrogenase (short-subunit alcohol dehydrogenase family)